MFPSSLTATKNLFAGGATAESGRYFDVSQSELENLGVQLRRLFAERRNGGRTVRLSRRLSLLAEENVINGGNDVHLTRPTTIVKEKTNKLKQTGTKLQQQSLTMATRRVARVVRRTFSEQP